MFVSFPFQKMAKFLSILLLLAAVISLQWSNAEIVGANANNAAGDDAIAEQGLVDDLLQLPQESGVPVPPGTARKPMTKNAKILIGLAAAALLALLSGGGYLAYSKFAQDDEGDKAKGDGVDGPVPAAATAKPRSDVVGLD